jgi:hypothetical protein
MRLLKGAIHIQSRCGLCPGLSLGLSKYNQAVSLQTRACAACTAWSWNVSSKNKFKASAHFNWKRTCKSVGGVIIDPIVALAHAKQDGYKANPAGNSEARLMSDPWAVSLATARKCGVRKEANKWIGQNME